mmetsp:Transcript_4443/g.13464  ORF Transcript_4443/g.13464 Transcript_4443/m.13464 type:complete len:92 (+) Transcript_4443:1133-1408(+)
MPSALYNLPTQRWVGIMLHCVQTRSIVSQLLAGRSAYSFRENTGAKTFHAVYGHEWDPCLESLQYLRYAPAGFNCTILCYSSTSDACDTGS